MGEFFGPDPGRRVVLTVVLAAGLVIGFASAPAWAQTGPRQILARSLNGEERTFVGVQVVEESQPGGRMRQIVQRVYRKGPILRLEYLTGQVLFDDGRESVMFFPRGNLIQRGESRQARDRMAQTRRQVLSPRLPVEQLPDENVAGRPCWVVAMRTPRGDKRKVWIDRESFLHLRLEENLANGRSVNTYFRSIELGKEPPAEKLAFHPPAGAREAPEGGGRAINMKQARGLAGKWGRLLEPAWVPEGFRFRGFYERKIKGQPVVIAVYDGPAAGQTFSVFQGSALGMGGPNFRLKKNLGVLSARKGEIDLVLVGSLQEEDLRRVADSMQ